MATGKGYSVKEIVDKTIGLTGKKLNFKFVDRRYGDPGELIASSKNAYQILNWEPQFSSLDNILLTMLKTYNV